MIAINSFATDICNNGARLLNATALSESATKEPKQDDEDADVGIKDDEPDTPSWSTLLERARNLDNVKGSCNPYRHATGRVAKYNSSSMPIATPVNGVK